MPAVIKRIFAVVFHVVLIQGRMGMQWAAKALDELQIIILPARNRYTPSGIKNTLRGVTRRR